MNALESKEITINGNYYVMTAMEAVEGMDFITNLYASPNGVPSAKDMRAAIIKNVKLGGKAFTEKSYGIHFSRNYEELSELFEAYMDFNYGEYDPNESGDPSESEDTQD